MATPEHASPAPTNQEIGAVLRDVRLSLKLNQRAASRRVGMSWQVISRIERGERPCRVTELLTMAQSYGYPVDRLVRAISGDPKLLEELRAAIDPQLRLGLVFGATRAAS